MSGHPKPPPALAALDRRVAAFCCSVPKAELHVHIEGTLEPELELELALRNQLPLPFTSSASAHEARDFSCLSDFLALYYGGCAVLMKQLDFHELCYAYLLKAASEGVKHAEIFFDPQSHLTRGVSWEAIICGLASGAAAAERATGVTASLILCFLRHLGAEAAMETLSAVLGNAERRSAIIGVGLDSNEIYDNPSPWVPVFNAASAAGLRLVCHAGEEESAAYMTAVLDELKVDRVDHGVRCLDDPALLARCVASQVPLTTCPLSNAHLRIYGDEYAIKLAELMRTGACVTINSDDPAYFLELGVHPPVGGYIGANYRYAAAVGGLDLAGVAALARNSVRASFVGDDRKAALLKDIDDALAAAAHKTAAPAEAVA